MRTTFIQQLLLLNINRVNSGLFLVVRQNFLTHHPVSTSITAPTVYMHDFIVCNIVRVTNIDDILFTWRYTTGQSETYLIYSSNGRTISMSHLYHAYWLMNVLFKRQLVRIKAMVFQCHFQQYFGYIMAASFIGGGNQSTKRKSPTCCKSLINYLIRLFLIRLAISGTRTHNVSGDRHWLHR